MAQNWWQFLPVALQQIIDDFDLIAASEMEIYLASVLESVMLLWAMERQQIGTSNNHTMNPMTLGFIFGSPTQSMS
jgi:hypothetical protein